ncbi:hypothetical protein HID58_034087 [Brassica napus]|uniref:Uncharacterized protein n=1 Tax=Brassica napus TaxID=3708 RepID=A0ABQ8C124_BRANA|nr:hypothetical protein HID58_034087 [Brassica napus]
MMVGTLKISLLSPRFKRPQLPETRVSFNRDLFTFKDESSSNILQNQGVSPKKSRGDEEQVTSLVISRKIEEITIRYRLNTKGPVLTSVQNEFRLEWNLG